MNPIEALKMHGVGVGKKLVGDAQSADVRAGKTFSNAQGNDKQGTMPVRSLVAQTITPGVNNIIKQAGIYDGDITIEGDLDLVGANIASGKSIFGIAGSFSGKRYATGSATSDGTSVTVRGLAFQPKIIIVLGDTTESAWAGFSFFVSASVGLVSTDRHSKASNDANYQNAHANATIYTDGFKINSSVVNVHWIAFE